MTSPSVDRSRGADALRDEFFAAAHRRRGLLAQWRSGGAGELADAPSAVKQEPDELFRYTRRSLAGLALFDGGIRSANFALGALRGLAAKGALEAFDFRSTVPGRGFTGGHALVERGCRYIYLLGGGADPTPSFSAMGRLIRRCRIDFGAEIALADGVALGQVGTVLANAHVVRGTITYSPAHLRRLGWDEDEIAMNRWGQILWVKPATSRQTTVAQFDDQSRFANYRKLGYRSVSTWLKELPMPVIAIDPSSLFPFGEL